MDEEIIIVGADGTEHVFPAGMDPKRAAAIVRGQSEAQPAPEAPADGGIETISLAQTVKNIPRSALNLGRDTLRGVGNLATGLADDPIGTAKGIVPGIIDHYVSRYGSHGALGRTVQEDPVGMVADMLPVAGALKAAPAAARATARGARTAAAETAGFAAKHPTAVSTIGGAVPGVVAGNPMAALLGAGYGFERAPMLGRRFARLEKQLRPSPSHAPTAAPVASAGAQAVAATGREALLRELIAREPNWRTTDAVPVDAITRDITRGGKIIEAGESRIGLGERIAQLLKEPTPANLAEADRLARAARQRMHITRKSPTGGRIQ